MSKYVCNICGYVYDEAIGMPSSGINAGRKWEDLPNDFVCPLCKAPKSHFKKDGEGATVQTVAKPKEAEKIKALTPLEMSILCSNLARGCEKQYLPKEQEAFTKLAQFFKSAEPKASMQSTEDFLSCIDRDLDALIPYANQTAKEKQDRGAMRALVWNSKVTQMLKSLLARYSEEGEKMLENTGIYVCTICGFIHIGDTLPDVCPVCKVPNYKFEKIERGA